MVQPPIPPTEINPHDDDVEDDSLLRTITTPPERDRIQAQYGDEAADVQASVDGAMPTGGTAGGGLPIVPIAIVAIIVIAILLFWLL